MSKSRLQFHFIPLLSGALLLSAAALPWWGALDYTNPPEMAFCRVLCAGVGVVAVVGAFWRPLLGSLFYAAPLVALVPFLAAFYMDVADQRASFVVQAESAQAKRLIRMLFHTDYESERLFLRSRPIQTDPVLVAEPDFTQKFYGTLSYYHWAAYVCVLGGVLLFLGCYSSRNQKVGKWAARAYGSAGAAAFLWVAVPQGLSQYERLLARKSLSAGDFLGAQRHFQSAESHDRNLDNEYIFLFDMGRLEHQLGHSQHPLAKMAVADIYASASSQGANPGATYPYLEQALKTYRTSGNEFGDLPTARYKQAQLLLADGCAAYNLTNYESAYQLLLSANRLLPHNVETLYLLGMSEEMIGRYSEARSTLIDVINLNESVGIFSFSLAGASDYRKPITSCAWRALAYCYDRSGDFQTGKLCRFNSTLTKSPTTHGLPKL